MNNSAPFQTRPARHGANVAGAPGMVSLRKVSKSYPSRQGSIEALRDIDLEIVDGEFVSIVGPSGCGKSTLLRCVAGLEGISAGDIEVAGAKVDRPPRGLGLVFQRDVLLDWRTVLDNVLVTAEFEGIARSSVVDRAMALIDMVGLKGYEHRFPHEMSGGMRQRAAICRALLCEPRLLLMDEPFGALDALTRDDLNMELQSIWQRDRKTILFITHGIDEAVLLSDRVVVMDRGPGRIILDLAIPLVRPRTVSMRNTEAFAHLYGTIRTTMVEAGLLRSR